MFRILVGAQIYKYCAHSFILCVYFDYPAFIPCHVSPTLEWNWAYPVYNELLCKNFFFPYFITWLFCSLVGLSWLLWCDDVAMWQFMMNSARWSTNKLTKQQQLTRVFFPFPKLFLFFRETKMLSVFVFCEKGLSELVNKQINDFRQQTEISWKSGDLCWFVCPTWCLSLKVCKNNWHKYIYFLEVV